MKKKLAIALFCLIGTTELSAQYLNGEMFLKEMHKKYYHGTCKIYTFSQKNSHYRNDTIIGTSVWHEAIEFPDKFRIDYGDKRLGNYKIYRHDSVFGYKNGILAKSRVDSSSLLLILGGMYYREFADVLNRLEGSGYKYHVISEQMYGDKSVYVIGALQNDLKSNQIWIDKSNLRVLRILEMLNPSDQMDMRFESHQEWCNGYVETKVSFRKNGKLEQVEEYYDIKTAEVFPEK